MPGFDERSVDEEVIVGPKDIGEHPAVLISRVGIAFEPDVGAAGKHRTCERCGLGPTALSGSRATKLFGRVDPQQTHGFGVVANLDGDRVAIDNIDDIGNSPAIE